MEEEKIITEYLDSKKFNKEEDLKKLKQIGLKQKAPLSLKLKPLLYSVATVALVLIITLSVLLPRLNNKGETPVVYFDDSKIAFTEIEDYNELHLLMDNKALKPNVVAQSYLNKSITALEDNKQIGIYSVLTVYTQEVYMIYTYSIYSNYILSDINIYNLSEKTIWNDYEIEYKIVSYGMNNIYEISFTHNKLYHYFKVESFTAYEIPQLMDALFL